MADQEAGEEVCTLLAACVLFRVRGFLSCPSAAPLPSHPTWHRNSLRSPWEICTVMFSSLLARLGP